MKFQIITDKRLPITRAGRSAIVLHYRKDTDGILSGLENRKSDTGSMKVSCPELTVLDLLRYPHASGGLNHIATVLSDLGERIDPDRLVALSGGFARSAVQRLGHMLDRLGHQDRTNPPFESVSQGAAPPWIKLEPAQATYSDFMPDLIERDDRWHVIVRLPPEPDA